MATAPMMMTSRDIAAFRNCSLSDARYLVMKFERDGLMLADRKRNKLVDIHTFARWYATYTKQEYKGVLMELKWWMKDRYAPEGQA